MFTEREMTLDALEMAKTGASELTVLASEISNPALRQQVIQMRNHCEQTQQQLVQYAVSRNIYMPAPPAPTQEIAGVAQFLQQSVGQTVMA